MVVKHNWPVGRKQLLKLGRAQRMRMLRLGREDQQVSDINHADLQSRRKGAQELGGFDNFESDLDADADEDDVWLVGFVDG